MCNAFIWYYPYIRKNVYGICSSEIRNHAYRDFLGIWNETWYHNTASQSPLQFFFQQL